MGGALVLVFSLWSCADKDGNAPECPDLEGTPCEDVGIVADDWTGYCDACEQLWYCFDSSSTIDEPGFRVYRSGRSCTCIGPDGYLYSQYDKDAPIECQYSTDPGRRSEGP